MRSFPLAAAATLFAGAIAASAASAQTKIPCGQTVTHPLSSRAALTIDSRPAGLHIVPTDREELHVTCTTASDETAADYSVHFSPTPGGGKLSIDGPHLHHGNNNLEIKIEVPRRTSLRIRMFAGQVTIDGVKGDKDISLGAGQITIAPIHPEDYRSVSASVTIGEVQARAFGADKGGFFRSVKRTSATGDYRLQAHVTTGQIDLQGNADQTESKPD